MGNINVIYKRQMNLYGNLFLAEYIRVSKLTEELNKRIGFPIYKITIDTLNSELRVENRFLKKRKSIKRSLNYVK